MTPPAASRRPLVTCMSNLYKLRPERWPQFGLRGFFVLVTLLGIFLGGLLHWAEQRKSDVAAIRAAGGQFPDIYGVGLLETCRRVVGGDYFYSPRGVNIDSATFDERVIRHLKNLGSLEDIFVNPAD